MSRRAIGPLLLLVLAGGAAGNEESSDVPRPETTKVFTADAVPIGAGHIELELFYAWRYSGRVFSENHENRDGPTIRQNSPLAVVTVGVLPDLDFNLAEGAVDLQQGSDRDDSATDLALNVRWRFLNKKETDLQLSYLSNLVVPEREFGDDDAPASQKFFSTRHGVVATKIWGRWNLNTELQLTLPFGEDRRDSRAGITTNIAAGCQVLKWLQPEIEINGAYGVNVRRRNDIEKLSVSAGLIMPINDRFRIDFGVQQDIFGRNTLQQTSVVIGFRLAW